jgi:hypothetical protein
VRSTTAEHGVAGAVLMALAHVLAGFGSFWFMQSVPLRYENLLSQYNVRLPAATEAVFALAHRATSRLEVLRIPFLFLFGLDTAALLALRWHNERRWSWVWFLVILGLLLLPMTLTGAGAWLAEKKMQEWLSHQH